MRTPAHVIVLPDRTRVRLAPGSHGSPHEGVCVVELASLLAREDFSDRPRCVCPVIAAYLRGWNDRAAHAERQRLAPYAMRIVGSRADRKTTRRRRDICLEWAGAELRRGSVRALLSRLRMRVRIAIFCGVLAAFRPNEGAADYTARVAMARRDMNAAFGLLDELLAVGGRPDLNGHGTGNGHTPANGHAATNGYVPGNGHALDRAAVNGHRATRANGAAPQLEDEQTPAGATGG